MAPEVTNDSGTFKISTDGLTVEQFVGKVVEFLRDGANPAIPDFKMDLNYRRGWLQIRSIQISDQNDPPDLSLNRAGSVEGQGGYGAEMARLSDGEVMGTIYFRAMGGNLKFYPDTPDGKHSHGRNVSIYARAVGDQTNLSRAGELFIATVPLGSVDGVVRLHIRSGGRIYFWADEISAHARLEAGPPDSGGPGYRALRIKNNGEPLP